MNKQILLAITQQALNLYLKNELTQESFHDCITKTPYERIETEKISYLETKFLYFVFETIPYYRICDFMFKFTQYLHTISKDNKDCSNIATLIESYISDIFIHIDSRIATEINAHIYELAEIYYQCDLLDYDLTMKRLKRQLIPPYFIVSMESTENFGYTQEKLPGFKQDEEPLRERISKNNFNKKYNTERSLKRLIVKYYDSDKLESFITALENNIKAYQEENKNDANILFDHIKPALQKLFIYAIQEWEQQKTKKEDIDGQIRLIFT